MSQTSRRSFLKTSLSLAAVAASGPTILLARLQPVSFRRLNNTTVAGTYTLKVSDFPTFTAGTKKIGLTEPGSSIKLTSFEELLMNPDHCERSGRDGTNYPIAVVRVKESGEDAFRAVSTWCPHNNKSQLDLFDHTLGDNGLFVCSEHEHSCFRADGSWVSPEESPYPDAPSLDEFVHNIGEDGKPHLTRFATSFDGDDTLTIFDVLCECEECDISSAADDEVGYGLDQNYPNPASHLTIFRFTLPEGSNVRLTILSTEGTVVATPVDRYMNRGRHEVDFNVRELSSGAYFFKLESSFGTRTRRMTVVK